MGHRLGPVARDPGSRISTNALRELAGLPDIIQSVLTGNTREAAEIKLRTFDLDQYLDLDIGAYGADDTRANLVKIARQRASAARGIAFAPATTVLIGDTPNDVAAARDGGARIIAVATGSDSARDLAAAGLCLGEARPAHAGPYRQVPLLINRVQPLRRSVLHAAIACSECVPRYVPLRMSPGEMRAASYAAAGSAEASFRNAAAWPNVSPMV